MSTVSLRNLAAGALCCACFAGTSLLAYAEDDDRPAPPRSGERHQHRKPPQEAYDACVDQEADTACQVTFRARTIEGTCTPDREDGTLFCRPDRPPPPPQQGQTDSQPPS
ncbi:MAG: hypothetical protein ABW321_29140 [Polyangiales bacterium]